MCRGSKDTAISALKSLLTKVHGVDGRFRIENSKTVPYPYVYMVCTVCRDAKCGIEQKGAGKTWTIKSVTTAVGSACVGGQRSVIKVEEHGTATSSTTLVQDASALAVAALNTIDVHQLLQAVSPDVQQLLRQQLLQAVSPNVHQLPQAVSADVHHPLQAVSPPKIGFGCSLCNELFDESVLARCGNGMHRFCGTCFCKLVGDAIRGPSKGVFSASGCIVPCTWCTPKSSFDVQKYAALLSKDCFQEWLEAVAAMKVDAESAKWEEKMRKKEEEVFDQLLKAGAASEEMQVQRHYDHIADTLIQPCCPACGIYIPDFDACCALQCGRRDGVKWAAGYGCGAHMCAWCLCVQATEQLVHDHVKLCDFNPVRGSMYPPSGHPLDWHRVMHEFARKRVKEYILDTVPSGLQKQVYSKVQTSNAEIGLGLQPWGTTVSDGFRQTRDLRVPKRASMEDNVTTLLEMGIVDNRAQAVTILEASQNVLETAVTFAMARR